MKVAILGAGTRTPLLLRGLVAHGTRLPISELTLHDTDRDHLETMGWFARGLAERWNAPLTLRAVADPREAVSGARFVLSAIRVGGDDGRVTDERIALDHGVLGQETTGPGGFAMALRTIPAMLEYARLISETAPEALVVNFANPAGLITQALTEHGGVEAVGICDTPVAMKRSLARFLGASPDDVELGYVGLNHLGWARAVSVGGTDRLPELLDRYEELSRAEPDWGLFDADLVRDIEMLPNEYLHYFYARRAVLERLRNARQTRGEQVRDLNRALWSALAEAAAEDRLEAAIDSYRRALARREATYLSEAGLGPRVPETSPITSGPTEGFEGSGYEGLAAAVMVAALGGHPGPLILNVPAAGAVPGMSGDDVVEVPCRFEGGRPRPLGQDPLPRTAASLVAPVKAYERLTVRAAVTGSASAAAAALTAHPLVGDHATARSLANAYLGAHSASLDRPASKGPTASPLEVGR